MSNVRKLTVVDHRRDSAGLRYVYPVVSRRAGGVSIGINLNVNNACNWACVYCQVENLVRGGPDAIDLALLEHELSHFIDAILAGDFMLRVPDGSRRLVDVAFSGNGEPTMSGEFAAAVDIALRVMASKGLLGAGKSIPLRLITNGSQLGKARVRSALAKFAPAGGEVWFKLDRGGAAGIAAVNQVTLDPETVTKRLAACAEIAPTWVQTCWFATDRIPPSEQELEAYLAILRAVGRNLRGVHLYGIARPSMQPGAQRLSRLPESELQRVAAKIAEAGFSVNVSP